ncbi:MAG: chloride channel protein [Prolixibacteraceae bacterium]
MEKMNALLKKIEKWRMDKIPERKFILLLSLVVGALSGLAAITLKNLIHFTIHHLTGNFSVDDVSYQYLAYPMIGILITVILIKFLIKEDLGHGVSKILYAFSKKNSKISRHNMYSSMVTSTITIGFGGSVGAEAPVALTGAAIGSNLAQFFRLNYRAITLLAGCGSSAAIAGIFNAPLAGLLFTIEVLMIDLTMSSLLPLLISAVTATTTSYFLMGDSYHFRFSLHQSFDVNNLHWVIILGVLCGLISVYFTRVMRWVEGKFKKQTNFLNKVIIGGIALGLLIFLFPSLWGEGYVSINQILNGNYTDVLNNSVFYSFKNNPSILILIFIAILAFKVFATAITTGAGGVGGIFAPTLFMGCFAGFIFSSIVNLGGPDLATENYALYGMAGVMAGVMFAPMTAVFLIAEITGGYTLFVPLLITSACAYLTILAFEKHSLYHSHLAERGELLTHNKDKTVLTLMKLRKVIETDLVTIDHEACLGDLVKVISKSKRNIFPVVDKDNNFRGVVLLDNIRSIMFNKEMYGKTYVTDLMVMPPEIVNPDESMEKVMKKFKSSGAWNLPVVENRKYIGFISKATIFSAYRSVLVHFSEE